MTVKEKERLRELAKKQRELANSLEMESLRKQHWELNTHHRGTYPTVRIETAGFRKEIIPDIQIQCSDPFARVIENQLLYYIYHHQIVGDDQLIPKTYQISWKIDVNYFGFPVTKTIGINTVTGTNFGFKVNHAISNIDEDFDKLKPLKAVVRR